MLFDFEDDDETIIEIEPPLPQGLPSPAAAQDIIGHHDVQVRLLNMLNNDGMPHALIFQGAKGIGKCTTAFQFAKSRLLKTQDHADAGLFGDALPPVRLEKLGIAADHPITAQIISGGYPDFLYVQRDWDEKKEEFKNQIGVENIRQINKFCQLTANIQGGWRVILIDDADTMNRNAQNAILKILEEPPLYTLIILIVHRMGAMIPTIRSRCQSVFFQSPTDADFQQLISSYQSNISEIMAAFLRDYARNSIGVAVDFLDHGESDLIEKILQQFELIQQKSGILPHYHFADSLNKASKDTLKNYTKIVQWAADYIVRLKIDANLRKNHHKSLDLLYGIANNYDLLDLLHLRDHIKDHFELCDLRTLDAHFMILESLNILKKALNK